MNKMRKKLLKKFTIIISFLSVLMAPLSVQARSFEGIDKAELKCLSKSESYLQKIQCYYNSMNYWQGEIDNYTKKFEKLLNNTSRPIHLKAKDYWERYSDYQFDVINETITKEDEEAQILSAQIKRSILKNRAQEMKSLYEAFK